MIIIPSSVGGSTVRAKQTIAPFPYPDGIGLNACEVSEVVKCESAHNLVIEIKESQ
jgi:hypothetical protein